MPSWPGRHLFAPWRFLCRSKYDSGYPAKEGRVGGGNHGSSRRTKKKDLDACEGRACSPHSCPAVCKVWSWAALRLEKAWVQTAPVQTRCCPLHIRHESFTDFLYFWCPNVKKSVVLVGNPSMWRVRFECLKWGQHYPNDSLSKHRQTHPSKTPSTEAVERQECCFRRHEKRFNHIKKKHIFSSRWLFFGCYLLLGLFESAPDRSLWMKSAWK